MNGASFPHHKTVWLSALLMSSALSVVNSPLAMAQTAQTDSARSFSIPAQPLTDALPAFGQQSGLQVSVNGELVRGVRTNGVSGRYAPTEALSRLLSGTGLSYRLNDSTVTLEKAPQASNAVQLGTIRVEGNVHGTNHQTMGGLRFDGEATDRPYATSGGSSYISGDTIDRFRGHSPADLFHGTPSVASGDARNGGGLDVNIRGMQGMGRVAVTVDGAANPSTNIYHGYQGLGNRSFIDMDLLAGADIRMGADAGSFGASGSVTLRTLSATDILTGDERFAVRLRAGFNGNTRTAPLRQTGGYRYPGYAGANPVAIPSEFGMDRPDTLDPTDGFGSLVVAGRIGNADLLAGYVKRDQGNYYAGENGPVARMVELKDHQVCTFMCQTWPVYVHNEGLTLYRGGEMVLNTSSKSDSGLFKLGLQLSDDHRLEAGYSLYRGENGHRFGSSLQNNRVQPAEWFRSQSAVDILTARYVWKPADNDLIDFATNLWRSDMTLRYSTSSSSSPSATGIGLRLGYPVGSDTAMWGFDVRNRSRLYTSRGDLLLEYGLSYQAENTRPSVYTHSVEAYPPKDGERDEAAIYIKGDWQFSDRFSLNAGLRYQSFSSADRIPPHDQGSGGHTLPVGMERDGSGFAPSVGAVFTPAKDIQLYLSYAQGLRMPSLMEGGAAFIVLSDPNLKPERSHGWEAGLNINRRGQFRDGDKAQFKLNYFNTRVEDYISRRVSPRMTLTNIDQARFEGIELLSRYETNGFSAELTANYFLNAQFCEDGSSCRKESLYGDYATNQVPAKYQAGLTLSQSLFADRLTIGARGTWVGGRAIGHGEMTAAGASPFIVMIDWDPYVTYDLFAEYRLNARTSLNMTLLNAGDKYYVDPLSVILQPAPGRSFTASLTRTFGAGSASGTPITPFTGDWSGLYMGAHIGQATGRTRGATTDISGGDTLLASEDTNQKMEGKASGFQIGYNHHLNDRWVMGVEADISGLQLSGFKAFYSDEEGRVIANRHLQAMWRYNFDNMATLRGRLGYSQNNALLYVTAGPAWLKETQSRTQFAASSPTAFDPRFNTTRLAFKETAEQTRTGMSVGGGVEYAVNSRISFKAEYLYASFGKTEFAFPEARQGIIRAHGAYQTQVLRTDPVTGQIVMDPDTNAFVYDYTDYAASDGTFTNENGRLARNKASLQTLRLGLNYRF